MTCKTAFSYSTTILVLYIPIPFLSCSDDLEMDKQTRTAPRKPGPGIQLLPRALLILSAYNFH